MTSDITRAVDYAYKHPLVSKCAIASKFKVSKTTLLRRLRGGWSQAQGHQSQQLLTEAEEGAIEEACICMVNLGFPASIAMLQSMAVNMLHSRVTPVPTLVVPGSRWHDGFFKRHLAVRTCYIQYLE